MKTSNKIVIAVVIVVTVLVISTVVGLRLYTDKLLDDAGASVEKESVGGSKEMTEREYELKGFTRVEIAGGWKVRIAAGDGYSVKIRGVGELRYFGDVSEEDVRTEGVTNITYGGR